MVETLCSCMISSTLATCCVCAFGLLLLTETFDIVSPLACGPVGTPNVTVVPTASTESITMGAGVMGNVDTGHAWLVPSNTTSYRPGWGAVREIPLLRPPAVPQFCGAPPLKPNKKLPLKFAASAP